MAKTARISVRTLKLTTVLNPADIPIDLVPADGPAGEPVIELVPNDSGIVIRARVNGKSYRKMLKTIAEHGAEQVTVILQGTLKPPAGAGGTFVLESAGFSINIKAPKTSDSAAK